MIHTNATNGKDLSSETSRVPASQLSLGSGADVLAFEARRAYSSISRHKQRRNMVCIVTHRKKREVKSAFIDRKTSEVGLGLGLCSAMVRTCMMCYMYCAITGRTDELREHVNNRRILTINIHVQFSRSSSCTTFGTSMAEQGTCVSTVDDNIILASGLKIFTGGIPMVKLLRPIDISVDTAFRVR